VWGKAGPPPIPDPIPPGVQEAFGDTMNMPVDPSVAIPYVMKNDPRLVREPLTPNPRRLDVAHRRQALHVVSLGWCVGLRLLPMQRRAPKIGSCQNPKQHVSKTLSAG
jgi:hypothetical protein